MNCRSLLCLAFVALLLTSCGGGGERAAMLDRADSLMSVSPAQALDYTDSLISTGEGGGHFQSQLQLRRLNAKNKLDTVFTRRHVDEAKSLVEHFDRHGTPNERMLAHYLLGRTYADTHEAPMALEAYQDAVSCADTTAADCNYYQLCRVYSQMANIFYRQGLYQEDLAMLDKSVHYAIMAKDTVGALLSYMQKMDAYELTCEHDSSYYVFETVYEKLNRIGEEKLAAGTLAFPVRYLINKGEFKKARRYLDMYEQKSGYFDSVRNIVRGREIYYYTKGLFYHATHQYDSAEYFFRKELQNGKDFGNQNSGSHGLALMFLQTQHPDSAAKYALYSYAMNDSVYAHMTTQTVEQMKGMYDYSRHQREAQIEKNKSDRKTIYLWVIGTSAFFLMALTLMLWILYKQKSTIVRLKEKEYSELLNKYCYAEERLRELKQVKEVVLESEKLDTLIHKLELEMEDLKLELAKYKQQDKQIIKHIATEKEQLEQLPSYLKLKSKINAGRKFTPVDWVEVENILEFSLPRFYQFISSRKSSLIEYEYKTCLLIRLHFKPKSVSYAIGVDASYITIIRRTLCSKLLSKEGSSKDFDKMIMQIR